MKLLSLLLSPLFLFTLPFANAQQISIVEGTDYTVLETPLSTSSGDKIEVQEFFWYGCPHCYSLEDDLIKWKKSMPANANYVPTPVPLDGRWELHARLFYSLAALNKSDELHEEIFDYIHADKKPLNTKSQVLKFVESKGIDADTFEKTMQSFAVNSQITNAYNQFRQAQLSGVPNIVVDGKYVTSPYLTGSEERTIDVINALIAKASAE